MTIKRIVTADRRIPPINEHAYTLPVVRELPAPPPDAAGAQSLW
jgi:hypothetical protein